MFIPYIFRGDITHSFIWTELYMKPVGMIKDIYTNSTSVFSQVGSKKYLQEVILL